ncbi:CocE/NonD family hydrolase [Streptomyces sp. MB09-01]|uniref:CocE/NonD family hydrolase n=1 Tax=Streptomyces sp. MB09-01 TaxID=3028666 RepID=UPI0029AD180A|nr:CocE/NonD family hydrolase [Streptomyces sp. MB09-01]MDX3537624.1 CocE/NonD family hydrolase [Streptomyces sp. MB09-01]
MSHPQDDNTISAVTAAELSRIAGQGIYRSATAIDPAAVNVAEALVATLNGSTEKAVLTPELQKLTEQVRQRATIGFPRITAKDGVKLSAHTIKLNTSEPRPVVIVPAGWTPFGWLLFEYTYLQLALRGYHVLAYTPRGIGLTAPVAGGGYVDAPFTSGGTIDVAGPKDWTDGSTVIDYAEEHFNPSAVAFLGESYGSGISQLVAANDPAGRVAAVVALSTWGELADSLYRNDTRHLAAVQQLIDFTGGPVERKFDEATRQILEDFQAGRNLDRVVTWGKERSPSTYVDRTNTRDIPTFLSNTWHETLFGANPVVEHFDRLTVPKRLNLWIGDHAAPEGAGLTIPFSGPNVPVEEALAWLDHHVLGTDNGVDRWPAVNSQIMFTYQTRTDPETGQNVITEPAVRETSPSWADVTTSTERWYLTASAADRHDGGLATAPESGWKREFTAGELTEATAVDAIITTGQAEWKGNPKAYSTDTFDRQNLAVWTTGPLQAARRIRGVPELTLTVRSSVAATTLVAYLFDVSPDNTARIITHEPLTLPELSPGEDRSATWQLQAAGYDLAPDHRLMLVVNSKDKLYSDAHTGSSTTTITSTDDTAAHLVLPLG